MNCILQQRILQGIGRRTQTPYYCKISVICQGEVTGSREPNDEYLLNWKLNWGSWMYCRGRGERGGRTTQHISVAKHFHQTNLFCLETKLNPLKMQLDLTCMWEYNLQGLKIPLPSSHIEIFPSGYSNTVLCDYALLAIKSKACYKASQIV